MRAATLKTYAGQAALPGGKADSASETAWQTARREAHEEIGLPLSSAHLPSGFHLEPLCRLPMHLAQTDLGVVPTVAFLSAAAAAPPLESTLIPRPDGREVAAVFSAPFHNFLRAADEHPTSPAPAAPPPAAAAAAAPAEWYRGRWTTWHGERWRMHSFHVPVAAQRVTRPRPRDAGEERDADAAVVVDTAPRFRVFGLTARILVDAARVAYAEEPEFEHDGEVGDEAMIARWGWGGRGSGSGGGSKGGLGAGGGKI